MARLSQITESVRLAVNIPVQPYFPDHCFEGNAVLPAVEALQLLATAVKDFRPDTATAVMADARFDKFLYIQPGTTQIVAFVDIGVHEDGAITAGLLTKNKSNKSSITRIKEHATVRFPVIKPDFSDQPLERICALEGICIEIAADEIYRDLIPFGPAYHNIQDILYISEAGAIAKAGVPASYNDSDNPGPLGSPFVLDAALHAACVWGQRYTRTVAFPIGIEKRVIFKRTRSAEAYFSRILPVRTKPDLLIFDIWIYDQNGDLFEVVSGVQMRDVSAGRIKPPQWIVAGGEEKSLDHIKHHCQALSVIELKTVLPFADQTLSRIEQKRSFKMKARRKQNYLASRLACKRLSRALSGNDVQTPAATITTICSDRIHPCCPLTDGSLPFSCSVSHDDRFAFAAASEHRIGIDVEKISQRVLNLRRLYMSAAEQNLVQESRLGEIEAALRIWSIKESITKALGMTLADSWHRVRVMAIGQYESSFQIDDNDPCTAVHDIVGQHVFTLVCRL